MDKNRNPRIGLLGGTFNPVHKGHVELGLKILEAFHLDKILYILSANPPHKNAPHMVAAELRWVMLNRALAAFPFLEPCDIEMKRSQVSWTIDTIEQLAEKYPGYCFYFISGSEGFLKIRTWKNYRKLLRMLSFIIVARKDTHKAEVAELLNQEGITLSRFDGIGRRMSPVNDETGKTSRAYWFAYPSDRLHISSTLIRRKVKDSENIDQFVHEGVKIIMEEKKLYEK
ncbi:MAG: nicotinate (nicotinamide) nucleotide adenylyltransferase [bacterium]|nr:nicotinate (nicotinamide) nucleotide adenylyltransferase [bacterium]